jgi:hypothetical protein
MISSTILLLTTLDGGPLVNPGIFYKQLLDVSSSFVSTGNSSAKDFIDEDSGSLVSELQEVQGLGGIHSADEVHH